MSSLNSQSVSGTPSNAPVNPVSDDDRSVEKDKQDNFKKVMAQGGDKDDKKKRVNLLSTGETKEKKPSLFDLAKAKKGSFSAMTAEEEELAMMSGLGVSGVGVSASIGDATTDDATADSGGGSETGTGTVTRFIDDKDRELVFGQEGQKDISGLLSINPQKSFEAVMSNQSPVSSVARTDLYEIVTQLVDKLYTLRTTGETDMVMVLKNPPMLDGAVVKLSTFDQAKGQFNISFENLSSVAKNFLDTQNIRDSLQKALESKGYMLHIVTTTTRIETPMAPAASTPQEGQQRFGGGGQQRQRQQQEKEKEET